MNYNNLLLLSQSYQLILGSASPRRLQLLTELGLSFQQRIPAIVEKQKESEAPFSFAVRLAEEKALSLSHELNANQIVIGCDTIVVLKGEVLGKPVDQKHAFEILSDLSGQNHIVCTACAFATRDGICESDYETTDVYFNKVSDNQILTYIDTGEPMDKAGAYGIQGMGAFLVDRIDGNLDTVIGLPRTLLESLAGRIMAL